LIAHTAETTVSPSQVRSQTISGACCESCDTASNKKINGSINGMDHPSVKALKNVTRSNPKKAIYQSRFMAGCPPIWLSTSKAAAKNRILFHMSQILLFV